MLKKCYVPGWQLAPRTLTCERPTGGNFLALLKRCYCVELISIRTITCVCARTYFSAFVFFWGRLPCLPFFECSRVEHYFLGNLVPSPNFLSQLALSLKFFVLKAHLPVKRPLEKSNINEYSRKIPKNLVYGTMGFDVESRIESCTFEHLKQLTNSSQKIEKI